MQILTSIGAAPSNVSAGTIGAPVAEIRPLRVCAIAETMMTGVGRHVTDVIKSMTARGHELHLLHSVARCDDALLHELEGLSGFQHRAFPMRRQPHWSDIPVLIALARYVRKFGPFDVIHGHSSKGGAYARLLSLFLPGTCLYTPHAFVTMGPHLNRLERAAYTAIEVALSYVTDAVICCSHAEVAHAESLGMQKERLKLIPHAIAPFDVPAAAGLRERLGLRADTVIIGFIGRLDEQKAPRVLVEAAAQILAGGCEVHVVMVGAGPLRAELEALTHACGIARHFSWLGSTPSREWISGFDVLAMPSLYEGFSYVLMEGLAAGVPIVCTPVGGVREVGFVDGVHGFVVPVGDSRAFADRLGRLIADPDLRQAMARRARDRSACLSLDTWIDRLEAIYRRPVPAAGALSSPAPSGL
jgi:glycosyltransferase involved in cell wall biosynthesis